MASICVAAVQLTSVPGDVSGNILRAEPLIRECAQLGAQLVLLPELFSSGYLLCSRGWKSAESITDVSILRFIIPKSYIYLCRANHTDVLRDLRSSFCNEFHVSFPLLLAPPSWSGVPPRETYTTLLFLWIKRAMYADPSARASRRRLRPSCSRSHPRPAT